MATRMTERGRALAQPRRIPWLSILLAIVSVGVILGALFYAFVLFPQRAAGALPPNEEPNPGLVIQPTTAEEVAPTSTATPTQEPTPTAVEPVVEYPYTEGQVWFERIRTLAAEEGCEVTYELVNVRETGIDNSLPWTVDENGETVQGIIPKFCGTGAFIVFGEIENKYPRGEVAQWVLEGYLADAVHSDVMIGPTHIMYTFDPRVLPKTLQGGLTALGRERLHEYLACLGFGPDHLDQYYSDKLPSLAVEIDLDLANAITGLSVVPTNDFYSQCLP